MTTRCAVYIRVNVGAHHSAESVRRQWEAAEAFVASQGWTCVATYEDLGYSAGTLARPGLQRLLSDMKAGKIDSVVVHTFDRLVRIPKDYTWLAAEFQRCGMTLVTLHPEPVYLARFAELPATS